MSYCVNCGVELEEGTAACPLCDTPVINPRESRPEKTVPSYPAVPVIPGSVKKKYFAFIASMVLLIPNAVLAVCDLLFIESYWSLYVISTCTLLWIWVIFPMLWKKPLKYLLLLLDSIALGAYIYVFYHSSKAEGWFTSIAVPVLVALTLVVGGFIKWLQKKRDWPTVVIAVLAAVAAMSVYVDVAANMFYYQRLKVGVSLVVCACCLSLMIFFTVVSRSRRFRAWVSRRFFI